MTKKLTNQEKALRLLKRAYKLSIQCDYNCSEDACVFIRLGTSENMQRFGCNHCEAIQLRYALRTLYGREIFHD